MKSAMSLKLFLNFLSISLASRTASVRPYSRKRDFRQTDGFNFRKSDFSGARTEGATVIIEQDSSDWGISLFDGVLSLGSSYEASAHAFAEFSLCSGSIEILRLRYLFDSDVEKLGGVAYQGECLGQRWTLHFFRSPYLLRESYRVLRNGILIAATDAFHILRSVEVAFSDGQVWFCHLGIRGLEVKDSDGNRVLHTSPRPGLIRGGSNIHIDHAVNPDRALPLLIILLHSTTHPQLI